MVKHQPKDDRYSSALLWGLLGAMVAPEGKRLQAGIAFAIGSPLLERLAGDLERQRQDAMRQERFARLQAAMQSSQPQPVSVPAQTWQPPTPTDGEVPSSHKPVEMERDSQWRRIIVHPAVVLVLGKRGSGKSVLGYRLLELFRYGPTPYVHGLPKQAHGLLPDWIGNVANLEDTAAKSMVLIDEAYLRYHSRESLGPSSVLMSRILNLSRQRQQTLVFVSQEARQVDKNIASSASVVVFKDLAMLQLQFDRPELNKLAAQAKQAFEAVKGDERRWSYVYSPDADFLGLLENSLPSFWSSKLSHAFAVGGEASGTKLPRRMTLDERIQKARELHQGGLSYQQIASVLGVTKSSAYNYVKGYPHMENASHG
ncbi:MAG: helix-turn-helix domain-containing protein [Dehalococcoidia bacterium]|nr:helix-turn-helix domain-containing protein [Dehalococcoidia bacterium]